MDNRNIEEQQMICIMKEKMKHLQQYTESLRIRSVLYGEEDTSLHIEDELVDYLHYTKSVIDCSKNTNYIYKNSVLDAMERKEKTKEILLKQDREAYILLYSMQELPKLEKELLQDLYIRKVNRKMIAHHQGDIVESTLNRRIRKALLHMYILFQQIS